MMLSSVKVIQHQWWMTEWMNVYGTLEQWYNRGKLMYSEKTCSSPTLSTINPTWTEQGSNLGFCSKRVGKSHLTPITDLMKQNVILTEPWLQFTYQMLLYKMLFLSNRNPAPNWNPVSSPDVLDYIRITGKGLQPGQGLFKERSEFLDSLPFIYTNTTTDRDEL